MNIREPAPESAEIVVARLDITPRSPVPLGGFASRGNSDLSTESETPLEANCVLIRQGGKATALLTLDTLYAADMEQAVRTALAARNPALERGLDWLIIGASHTHFAPMIDPAKPGLGALANDYRGELINRLVDMLATMVVAPGRAARFRSAAIEVSHAVNRRLPRALADGGTEILMGPNPAGPIDRQMTVGILEDGEGDPLAVLWAWACHPVCQPRLDLISADFVGHARRALREELKRDVPVLYFQGFSGDVRPRVLASKEKIAQDPTLAQRFAKFTPQKWEAWVNQVGGSLVSAYEAARAAPARAITPRVSSVAEPLGAFVSGETDGEVRCWAVQLTEQDLLVGGSAEISSVYALDIKSTRPNHTIFAAGCLGNTYGYLGTAAQIAEGGYETDAFITAFGLKGSMRPDADRRFRAMVEHILVGALAEPEPPSRASLAADVRRLGIQPGDVVLARASMRTVNSDSDTLIDAVLDVIGPDGTLAILAFTPLHPLKKLQPGDVFTERSPPNTGGFAQKLLDRPGAIRSRHPTNSWVALGPAASALLGAHGPDEPAFEPIRRLISLGGKFAVFGCVDTCPGFSTIHLIEHLQGQSEASPVSGQRGIHYMDNGVRKTYIRRDVPGCSRGYWKVYRDYFEAGTLHDGYVGNGYSFVQAAADAYAVESRLMNADPAYALCDDCTCPKREVALTTPLRPAPSLAELVGLAGTGGTDEASPATAPGRPPWSDGECLGRLQAFQRNGNRDLDALADARIAYEEYGHDRHAELLVQMLNAADPAVATPEILSELASGLPPAVLARLRRGGEIEWIAAMNRILKLERDPLDRTKTRQLYKAFMRPNLTTLRGENLWRSLLAPFRQRDRKVSR